VTLNGLNPPTYPAFGTGKWLSYDVPLAIGSAAFQNGNWASPPTNLKHLAQIVFTVPGGATIYVDNMYFFFKASGGGGATAPTAAPTAPTAAVANVMSLFSSTFTGGTVGGDYSGKVDSYNATCFGAPGTVADYTIAGTTHVVKKYVMPVNNYSIIELIGATGGTAVPPDSAICNAANPGVQTGSTTDIATMTALHFDIWMPSASTNFQVRLVYSGDASGQIPGAGQPTPAPVASKDAWTGALSIAAGAWVPIEIPFTTLAGGPNAGFTRLALLKFFTTDSGTFFIDNVYFHK
jgi:hypothetical protein